MGKVKIEEIVNVLKEQLIKKYDSEIIDFGVVNFDKLEHWCEIIYCDGCYLLIEENAVIKSLYQSFIRGYNVDEEVFLNRTYINIYFELVKKNILKPHTKKLRPMIKHGVQVGKIETPPRINEETIISDEAFYRYKLEVRKGLILLIFYKWLIMFLETKLDEFSKSGSFSETRIKRIKDSLEKSSFRVGKVLNPTPTRKKEGKTSSRVSVKNEEHTTSFYSFHICKLKTSNPDQYQKLIEEFRSDLVNRKYILPETEIKQIGDFFTSKSLDNPIQWNKSPYSLRLFIDGLTDLNICDDAAGVQRWLIAQNCFHLQPRGKSRGRVEKYTTISMSNETKKDNKEEVEELIKSFQNNLS